MMSILNRWLAVFNIDHTNYKQFFTYAVVKDIGTNVKQGTYELDSSFFLIIFFYKTYELDYWPYELQTMYLYYGQEHRNEC